MSSVLRRMWNEAYKDVARQRYVVDNTKPGSSPPTPYRPVPMGGSPVGGTTPFAGGGYAPLKPGPGPTGIPGVPTAPTGGGGGGPGGFDPCGYLPSYLQDACRYAGGQLPSGGGLNPYAPRNGGGGNGGGGGGGVSCPQGTYKVGNRCVSPGDAFPGGDPFTFPAGGRTTMGAFGMPAVTPVAEQRVRRRCPDGMVLGKDDLCYPKQVLPRRSKYRKWRGDPKPKISAQDWKTLKRAERVEEKAKEVAKTAGWKVTRR